MEPIDLQFSCITDEQLLVDLRKSLHEERARRVEFLRILGEVDARRLYVPMGFSSLFSFCVEGLGLSSDQAYRRAVTARAGRRFPSIWPMLESGALHMSGVAVLAKHLDEEGEALLARARGKSKVEIEAIVSTLAGDAAPRVTVRVVVSPEAEALWRRARALSGEEPGLAFEHAVEQYVARLEARKFKTTDRPRSVPLEDAGPGRRAIAAAVKRAVATRDGRRCTFVSDDGLRCGERERLEFDHVVPVARGGRSVVDNLRLRCRAHNQLEAERTFGRGFMERKRGTLPGQSRAVGAIGVGDAPPMELEPVRMSQLCAQGKRPARRSIEPARRVGPVAATLPGPSGRTRLARLSRHDANRRPVARHAQVADEARLALRALDFSTREAGALLKLVAEHVEQSARAEIWVRAALLAYRSGALDGPQHVDARAACVT